jgi:hypothetical protein
MIIILAEGSKLQNHRLNRKIVNVFLLKNHQQKPWLWNGTYMMPIMTKNLQYRKKSNICLFRTKEIHEIEKNMHQMTSIEIQAEAQLANLSTRESTTTSVLEAGSENEVARSSVGMPPTSAQKTSPNENATGSKETLLLVIWLLN